MATVNSAGLVYGRFKTSCSNWIASRADLKQTLGNAQRSQPLLMRSRSWPRRRYRIADGRGGVSVSAAYNCAQDANQALYSAVRWLMAALGERVDQKSLHPSGVFRGSRARREQLLELAEDIQHTLLPFGADRSDWQYGAETLSSGASRSQLKNLSLALRTWRTIIPPVAARALVRVFLKHGASGFVLRTFQVGGQDPDIEPYVPSW